MSCVTAIRARFGGLGVRRAVASVAETIAPAVTGRDPFDQAGLDAVLVDIDGTPDKSRVGANAMLGVSAAVARAAAASGGVPLWRHLICDRIPVLPLPMVNIVSGGLHATWTGWVFRTFSSFLSAQGPTAKRWRPSMPFVLPHPSCSRSEGFRLSRPMKEVSGRRSTARRRRLTCSWRPLSRWVAGPAMTSCWRLMSRRHISSTDSIPIARGVGTALIAGAGQPALERLADGYPIVSIEDGLAEDDWEGWAALTRNLGQRVQLVGDDLFTTNIESPGARNRRRGSQRSARQDEPDRDVDGDDRRN